MPEEPMADKPLREPYEPPRIVRVRLVAEEMAAGNCKAVRVGGPGSLVCNNGGVFVNLQIGS
jgi:hypothetical protein